MKRHLPAAICAAILLCTASACKPTEANYRAAYELTASRTAERERDGLTDEEYELIRRENAPKRMLIGSDSVAYEHKTITPVQAETSGAPRRYNLAVGRFAMSTNASSMRDRLHTAGMRAFIAKDAEGKYVVVAEAADTEASMAEALRRFATSGVTCSGLPAPMLIIMESAGRDRSRATLPTAVPKQ